MDSTLAQQAMGDEANNYDDLFPALPATADSPATPLIVDSGTVNKMRVGSSLVTQVFHLPVEERRFREANDFGGTEQQSKICADIMERTGAVIEISSAKDHSLTFLITGKQNAVTNARKRILENFQTQATYHIQIPKDHHRFILGKKGEKLQELQNWTGTKISVPRQDENSDKIKIIGPKEGIEKAVHEIQVTSDERSKQAYERLNIPKAYHPFITGAHNELINGLMNDYSVRINVPPRAVNKDEVTIAGEKHGVMQTKQHIEKQYQELARKCSTVSVEIDKSRHKYIVGTRGKTLAEILSETGVSVEMPDSESQTKTITLRGPQDKLGQGLSMVYDKANSVEFAEVVAPTWIHKYLIGKGGANIRKITQDLPKMHVTFNGDKVLLEGPPQEVSTCEDAIATMAEDLMARLTYKEIQIEPKYHKHIIGKNGANVNRLKQDYDVIISFPSGDSGSTLRLEGSKEGVKKVADELISMAAKLENECQKDILIGNRFHGSIIGPKGENIRVIREKFNNVIISFPNPGEKKDMVSIRGPKEDVELAYSYLKQLNKDLLDSNYQIQVPIFKQFHKFVIGKGGANIRKIRDETATRIELPSEGSDSDNITITGRKDAVENAKEKILSIQNEMANIVQVDIMIEQKFHNTMIGSGGKLIQSIMQDCGGVNIRFPPPELKSDKVSIRGPKKDCDKAKKMLLELASERQLNSHTDVIKAQVKHHRFLIGRNGANIRKVRESTGARIVFPSENDADREAITIIGKVEAVKEAKSQLEEMIKELDKIIESVISIDPKYHNKFVTRRGELLREISEEYGGVKISFPKVGDNSDKVVLKGAKDCVEGAIGRMKEMVAEYEATITIECVIPQQYHRTVMGAKGKQVQAITMDYNVQIKFPDRDDTQEASVNGDSGGYRKCDVITITGYKDKCEEAKEALLCLVPVTVEVDMPFDFHRFIIGQKGRDVREMMNLYDVNISIPPPMDQSNIIKVTGTPAKAEKAKEALEEKKNQLLAEQEDKKLRSYEVKIQVDPRHHPTLIGKGGATIQKLRSDYDVQIQLPKRGDPEEDVITITGYQESVSNAQEAIKKMVEDLEEMIEVPVSIDHRVHSRLIGQRGRNIRKVMDEFKVNIKFPQSTDPDPNLVVITGLEENAYDCKDRLQNLEEEFLQDIKDNDFMQQYMKPAEQEAQLSQPIDAPGFIVSGGPWEQSAPNMQSTEDFPSFGEVSAPTSVVWGPRR